MGFSSSAAAATGAAGAGTAGAGAAGAGAAGATAAGAISPALAQLSVGLGLAGAVNSTIGSYIGAKTQKQSLRHAAAMAEINSRIAELGAQSALLQGKSEVAKLTQQAGQLKGRQRAAMAANGIDLGVGNAAEVQASTDLMKEIDADTIKANALRSAWGYRTQAMNYQNKALTDRATASGISPFGSAASSLMGDAGQVASSWYGLQRDGAFGTTTDTNGKPVNAWW